MILVTDVSLLTRRKYDLTDWLRPVPRRKVMVQRMNETWSQDTRAVGEKHLTQPGHVSASPSPTSSPSTRLEPMGMDVFQQVATRILDNVQSVIDGKPDAVEMALTVFLAGGHLLIEDVPGVGKTMLAKALGRSTDCTVSRIQFTPDLLPSDVTGVSIFSQAAQEFQFKPGPVFANIVIGDEINRASPKTQSALLECMEEGQVTVDGMTHRLVAPFTVIATQNPVEMEGTYSLPEAQRDRFMARISMGYPDQQAELRMLRARDNAWPLESLRTQVTADELERMMATVQGVFVADVVMQYAVAIVQATRHEARLRLGASPRATLQLVRAAKARAALDGRDFVLPDDIDLLAVPVLGHRLIPVAKALNRDGRGEANVAEIITSIVRATPVPVQSAGT